MLRYYIIGIAMLLSALSGWYVEHLRFVAFETEVKAVALQQEEHVKSIEKQQSLITQEVKKTYETKLTALRSSYANRLSNASGSKVPAISCTASSTNEGTSNEVPAATITQLPEQCAETTLQLIELQNWVKQQSEVK